MKKDKKNWKVKQKHWYKIYMDECVLCGRGGTERVRVYGEKPKDYKEIYFYSQYACGHHF